MAHEELKKQYEKDCLYHGSETYKMWEFKSPTSHVWEHLSGPPCWDEFNQYRRHKEPPFQPEYFSGLNWRKAEKLIGKVVEFSDDCIRWGVKGVLGGIFVEFARKFQMKEGSDWIYVRTCSETHIHPTITIADGEVAEAGN